MTGLTRASSEVAVTDWGSGHLRPAYSDPLLLFAAPIRLPDTGHSATARVARTSRCECSARHQPRTGQVVVRPQLSPHQVTRQTHPGSESNSACWSGVNLSLLVRLEFTHLPSKSPLRVLKS